MTIRYNCLENINKQTVGETAGGYYILFIIIIHDITHYNRESKDILWGNNVSYIILTFHTSLKYIIYFYQHADPKKG